MLGSANTLGASFTVAVAMHTPAWNCFAIQLEIAHSEFLFIGCSADFNLRVIS
jgi:hypothetical protein